MFEDMSTKAFCTVCGYKATFYEWDDSPLDADNKLTAKNSPFLEKYCPTCHTMRVFQKQ